MDLNEILNELRLELIASHRGESRSPRENREALLTRIEEMALRVMRMIASNEFPRLNVERRCDRRGWINFARTNSRGKFAAVVHVASKMHRLLSTKRTATKRELYYENASMFKSQGEVDAAVREASRILGAPPWELGVVATATGLVAGPLLMKTSDGRVTDCSKPGGVAIPHNILDVELVPGRVTWALIVEKDAAFQRLLDANAMTKMKDCVFITGKGFPDVSTRLLVRRLWDAFGIPILALVDADAYGVEIMCVYRFGSTANSPFADRLACPSIRWLGVHPGDVKPLSADVLPLSPSDVRKLQLIAKRSYIKSNEKLRSQIQIFMKDNVKAEIEGISRVSENYITDVYIPSKIRCREYL